jgi:sorbitol-specific phosphotransferase system component IIC
MHLMSLLKSLDDLLYEVMSWLVFYPLTLWRVLRRPLVMMDYSDRELHQSAGEQYTDTLTPPLFLLVSLLLSHAIELAFVGDNVLVRSNHGLAALVDDDTSLVILRLVTFSVFPLMFAVRLVRAQHKRLTRDSLRPAFYAQCYAAAPFALLIGIGTLLTTVHRVAWAVPLGLAIIAATLLIYFVVQARWFAEHLKRSIIAGLGQAAIAMGVSLVMILLVAPLFA